MATDEHFQGECEVGYSLWALPAALWKSPYFDEDAAIRVLSESNISESEVKAALTLGNPLEGIVRVALEGVG